MADQRENLGSGLMFRYICVVVCLSVVAAKADSFFFKLFPPKQDIKELDIKIIYEDTDRNV